MRPSLRYKVRRKLGRIIEPSASKLLDWCRDDRLRRTSNEARLDEMEGALRALEARAAAAEARLDRSEWGREALVERINEQDIAVETVADRLVEAEDHARKAFWGREALVERFNEADWRTGQVDAKLKKMQNQIEEYVIRPLALELDNLAMSRRLATIEDLLDQALAQAPAPADPADLVPFRPADDDDTSAQAG